MTEIPANLPQFIILAKSTNYKSILRFEKEESEKLEKLIAEKFI